MPRPARALVLPLALIAGAATLSPSCLHALLASAAGTLFEAAPFLLLAQLGSRLRAVSALVGCGCGNGGVPGALAPAAIALTWLAFGPPIALARGGAGAALLLARRRKRRLGLPEPPAASLDVFAELALLAATSAGAALLASALGQIAPGLPAPALWAAGLLLGACAPCATAGVALAAGLAPVAPFAAAGVLATAGILPLPIAAWRLTSLGRARMSLVQHWPTRAARLLLAIALFALATRGPSGLVNPRLGPLIGAGAVVALLGRIGTTALRYPMLVPAAMLGALLAGSPVPSYQAEATRLDDAFAGERLTFIGVAHRRGAVTVLERFVITCCRLDATPVAVRLSRRLAVVDGTWIDARGILQRAADGTLVLEAGRAQSQTAPADPFAYR